MWASFAQMGTHATKEILGVYDEERLRCLIYNGRRHSSFMAFAKTLLANKEQKKFNLLNQDQVFERKSVKRHLLVAISEHLDVFKEALLGENLEQSALYALLSLRVKTVGKNKNSSSLKQLAVLQRVVGSDSEQQAEALGALEKRDNDFLESWEYVLRYERATQAVKDDKLDYYNQILLKAIRLSPGVLFKVSLFLKCDPASDIYEHAKAEIKESFRGSFDLLKDRDNIFRSIIQELKADNKEEAIIRLVAAADRQTYYRDFIEKSQSQSLVKLSVVQAGLFSAKLKKIATQACEMTEVVNDDDSLHRITRFDSV